MLNWFKRNKKKTSILANWDIGDTQGFKRIQNRDSVQYVNEDAGKVIYLSLLSVSGDAPLIMDAYTAEPKIVEDTNGWQLKGAKKSKDQILVCVVSVSKESDIECAKAFFESIKANETHSY